MKNSQTLTADGFATGERWPVKWRLPGVVTLSILLHVALIVGLLREERVPPLVMAGNAGGAVAFSVLSASHGGQAAAAAPVAQPAAATATAVNPSAAQPAGASAGASAGESARPLATEVTLPDPEIALPRAREAAREAELKAAASRQKNAQPTAQQQAGDPDRRTPRRSDSQADQGKSTGQPQSARRAETATPAAARQTTSAVTPSASRQTASSTTPSAARQTASPATQPATRQAERAPRAVADAAQPTAVRPPVSDAAAQNPTTTPANAAPGGQSAAASGSARQAAGSALNTGSSDSGNAARGAGSSNNQNFRALHRRVDYPQRAKALGVEGRVRIKFDVTASGTVTNVRILSETPAGVFAQSVTKDIARWRYQTQAAVNDQVASIVFKLNGQVALEN